MDLETRILVSISRKYSGIVPFWKMEIFMKCVLETGKITEEVLETGKIPKYVLENRKNSEKRKHSGTPSGNQKIPEHFPDAGKFP